MAASKKARRAQRSQYRATTAARASATAADTAREEQLSPDEPTVAEETLSTRPVAAVTPRPARSESDGVEPPASPSDPPTIILTSEQIALLSHARPPVVALPSPDDEGYDYLTDEIRRDADQPTIVLDVGALLAAPPPPPEAPMPPPPLRPLPRVDPPSFDAARQPLPINRASNTPTRKRGESVDPEEELARLRRQRLERETAAAGYSSQEPALTNKLRQWWNDLQPGIARVLGRSHRAGSRGARATTYQTSAQLPAVRLRSMDEAEAPAVQRGSQTARGIGQRAQTAAHPALAKMHSRAENMAQNIVDRIDERLGGRPPLQHVLLGPGRMIVSFAPNVTIRDAQLIISSIQARSLRRLVGYNAYLVLVPPGREARYAERLHAYRQVTGVHFGPQRPSQLPTTRQDALL